MNVSRNRVLFSLLALAALSCLASRATACTGIRLKAQDGSIIYARSMEFGIDLKSEAIIIPRDYKFVGDTASGKPGLAWQARYAVVGLNGAGQELVVDGLNEKGLASGIFYFPSYAQYQDVAPAEESQSLAPWQVVTWILTNFANVDEVRAGLAQVKVGNVEFAPMKMTPPMHFIVHDETGQSLVIEYVGGELKLYDNPIGVVTNSPTFDWHITNLRNYVNLTATNLPPVDLAGLKLGQLGQGSGMLGLPGDFTPPSRFVRAVALSQATLPGVTGDDTVRQAFHVLDSFDIPLGTVRSGDNGQTAYEYTQWTSASNLKSRSYYFHSYDNRRIRRLDLIAAETSGTSIITIPLHGEPSTELLTPRRFEQ